MFFRDIPGQKEVIDRLIRSVHDHRVSHAQLFAGGEGTGKFAAAMAYAQYISCHDRSPSDSCGICPSCVKYSKLIHPDLHFVFPIVKSKRFSDPVCDNYLPEWRSYISGNPFITINDWLSVLEVENAQAIIYAAEASEILRKLSLKTYEAEYKVMIIWLPERMHTTAANKLLKIIEEPPDKTLFLLVSDEPDKIIPTILSRCQLIKFPGIRADEMAGYIGGRFSLQAERAAEIAHISNGNLARAISIADRPDATTDELESFRSLMRHAWKRDVTSLVAWSDDMAASGREAQKSFLIYCLGLLRNNFILNRNSGSDELTFMTGAEREFSSKFYPFINTGNIERLYEEFNKAHYHIESNGNAKIVFLDLALQVAMLLKA
jgi:DNA polymerase III subunit delta'